MKRGGYSLVELLVVLAMLSLLIAAAAMALASLMVHFGRQRDDAQMTLVVRRFAAEFRRDVHAAHDAHVEDLASSPGGKLLFTLPDGETVLYAAIKGGVERTALQDQRTVQREFFRLPRAQELHFARESVAADRALLACTWRQQVPGQRTPEKNASLLRPYRIEAALAVEAPHE